MNGLNLGSLAFGFLAGVLSFLSPCVLPLLPVVLGGATAVHRLGVAALAAGLVVAFVMIGLFVATVGFSIGLDADWFRSVAALLLGIVAIVLLSGALQRRVALAGSGFGDAGHHLISRLTPQGLGGQFIIGLILGAVWSPCVGPTLGAASLLAAQGKDLATVSAVMLAFAVGAVVPLVAIAALSREALLRWRGDIGRAGRLGRYMLGGGALLVSALILTGLDRALETALVNASPDWLIDLTTRF
jgi:cytochrome c-type biogenesis protein